MGTKAKKAMADAAAREDVERVKSLLADGVKVNSIIDGRCGWTAIMYAAFNGRVETTKTLIEHGADVNVVAAERNSVITLAASHNHWEVAQLLAEAGADVNHENLKHKSAITYAGHAKQKAFLKQWDVADRKSG